MILHVLDASIPGVGSISPMEGDDELDEAILAIILFRGVPILI